MQFFSFVINLVYSKSDKYIVSWTIWNALILIPFHQIIELIYSRTPNHWNNASRHVSIAQVIIFLNRSENHQLVIFDDHFIRFFHVVICCWGAEAFRALLNLNIFMTILETFLSLVNPHFTQSSLAICTFNISKHCYA